VPTESFRAIAATGKVIGRKTVHRFAMWLNGLDGDTRPSHAFHVTNDPLSPSAISYVTMSACPLTVEIAFCGTDFVNLLFWGLRQSPLWDSVDELRC
jgi:hypothetical protein